MQIIIGADHGGVELKTAIVSLVNNLGIECVDVGCYNTQAVDYPDYALLVAKRVSGGEFPYGILVCGTGIGMAIAANKVSGIRCAVANDLFSAQMSREHNNTNILALGARILDTDLAEQIVKVWLETDFGSADRHIQRLQKIDKIENMHH